MRTLFSCLLLLLATPVHTQPFKGDLVLFSFDIDPRRANFQLTPAAYDLSNIAFGPSRDFMSISFSPKMGYMLNDRTLVGAGFGLTTDRFEDIQITTIQAEMFGRYFFTLSNSITPFGELSISRNYFGRSFGELEAFSTASLGLGLQINLAENVLFHPQVKLVLRDGPELGLLDLGMAFVLGRVTEETFTTEYGRKDFFIGGTLGQASLTKGSSGLSFSPQVYYLLTDRIALGLVPALEIDFFTGATVARFDLGLGLRYFVTKGNRIDLFAEAGLAAFSVFQRGIDPIYVYRASGGLLYFLRKNVALEAGLGISHFEFEALNTDTFTDFRLSMGIRFFLLRK